MKKGFTLIELLIVISILGILVALSMVSYTSAQRQGRDTQRKSDLTQYRNSLESYAVRSNGIYPIHSSGVHVTLSLCTELGISDCPEDPKFSSNPSYFYAYQSDPNGIKFVLWGRLENIASTFWVVCSTGQSGKITSSTVFSGGNCPSGLTQ